MRDHDLLDDYVHDRPGRETEAQGENEYGLASFAFHFSPDLVIDLGETPTLVRRAATISPSPSLSVPGRAGD